MQYTSPYQLFAANGTCINTYGNREMKVSLKGFPVLNWRFIVADISKPIIGADFLEHYDLVPDLKRKRLICGKTLFSTAGHIHNSNTPSLFRMDVTQEYGEPLRNLLNQYQSLFQSPEFQKEPPHDVLHYIETTGPPVWERVRRLRPETSDAVKAEIEEMVKMGICRPSKSPWASPMLIRKKPDNRGLRVCGDYRRLKT